MGWAGGGGAGACRGVPGEGGALGIWVLVGSCGLLVGEGRWRLGGELLSMESAGGYNQRRRVDSGGWVMG